MTNQVNDIHKVETNFYRHLGNGKAAASDFATMVKSVVSSRDTTVFVRSMDRIRKNKSDTAAIRAMKTVITAVWPGVKVKLNKERGTFSIIIRGIKADKAALARMDDAITRGLSLRDAFAKAVKGDADDGELVADAAFYAKMVKSIDARLKKQGGSWAELVATHDAKPTDAATVVETARTAELAASAATVAEVVAHATH